MRSLNFFFCTSLLMLAAFGASAQQVSTTATGSGQSKDQPIEISSDTLDVDQTTQTAIFRGNVVAIQGDMRLRSKEMVVFYRKKAEGQAPAAPQGEEEPSSVEKIEVHGDVVFATPVESAQGDDGLYIVDKRLLHLTGKNVVLTRGNNILRGSRLDYDMNTEKSTLIGAGSAPQSQGGTGGRVRGVFLPGSGEKK